MKKILLVMALILSIMLVVGCKSKSAKLIVPAAPAPFAAPAKFIAPIYKEQVKVYDDISGLIMDGAREYVVKQGDTLSDIARKETGNGFYYSIIVLASHGVVVNPDKIVPGMKLIIPDITRNRADENARRSMKNCLNSFANIERTKYKPDQSLIDGFRREAEKL